MYDNPKSADTSTSEFVATPTKRDADVHSSSRAMVMTAQDAQQRKRIEQKGKHRPDKMVRGKLPEGSSKLGNLPTRDRGAANEAAADDKYCKAIDKISSVFGQHRRSETTAAEHRIYMRVLDGWLVREGFGSYVEVVVNKAGSIVAVRARRDAAGVKKVLRPQMLIAHLLQMAEFLER